MATLGKTALYYRKNKKARDQHNAYQKEYNKKPEQRKYRSKLWVERRKRGIAGKGGKDLSHTKSGKLVLEDKSTNRARNNSGNNGRLKNE
jgi:hypothetical protein